MCRSWIAEIHLVGAFSSAAGICDAGDSDPAGVAGDWQ